MLYISTDLDWLVNQALDVACNGLKGKNIDIRFDNRNVNQIYYVRNGKKYTAWLNSEGNVDKNESGIEFTVGNKTSNLKYENLTFWEVNEINQTKKNQKVQNSESRLKKNVNTTKQIYKVVRDAKSKHIGKNDNRDITLNRKQEKEKLHKEQYIAINTEELPYKADTFNEKCDEVNLQSNQYEVIQNMSRIEKIRMKAQKSYKS